MTRDDEPDYDLNQISGSHGHIRMSGAPADPTICWRGHEGQVRIVTGHLPCVADAPDGYRVSTRQCR
jgi:hypothetical protein